MTFAHKPLCRRLFKTTRLWIFKLILTSDHVKSHYLYVLYCSERKIPMYKLYEVVLVWNEWQSFQLNKTKLAQLQNLWSENDIPERWIKNEFQTLGTSQIVKKIGRSEPPAHLNDNESIASDTLPLLLPHKKRGHPGGNIKLPLCAGSGEGRTTRVYCAQSQKK